MVSMVNITGVNILWYAFLTLGSSVSLNIFFFLSASRNIQALS